LDKYRWVQTLQEIDVDFLPLIKYYFICYLIEINFYLINKLTVGIGAGRIKGKECVIDIQKKVFYFYLKILFPMKIYKKNLSQIFSI